MVGFLFLSLETDRHVVIPSINFRASMTLVLFAIDDDDCGGILTWFHKLSILYVLLFALIHWPINHSSMFRQQPVRSADLRHNGEKGVSVKLTGC